MRVERVLKYVKGIGDCKIAGYDDDLWLRWIPHFKTFVSRSEGLDNYPIYIYMTMPEPN